MPEVVFASVEDYEARYGAVTDSLRTNTVLKDASDILLGAYAAYWGIEYTTGSHPDFDRAAMAVCCSVAHRSLAAPSGFEGASQFSQGAGPFSATVSLANPMGELFLGKSDLMRLGLDGQRISVIQPNITECDSYEIT